MKFKQFLAEEKKKDVVVFYGGRFQPMHKGHFELYKDLVKKFGKNNVYIATKLGKDAEKKHTKGDFSKDPLTFSEKVEVITEMFGVSKDHIVNSDPYRPDLSLIKRDPKKTSVILAFSEKDSGRLLPGKVMQPYPKDDSELEPLLQGTEEDPKNRMYYITMPVNFSGMSASDFREIVSKHGVGVEAKKAFKQFFGVDVKGHEDVLILLASKLNKAKTESLNVPMTMISLHAWPKGHSSISQVMVNSDKPKIKPKTRKKGKKLFKEDVARFLGQGKYHGQTCYIIDRDIHNKLLIQFLDGTQLPDVSPTEVRVLKHVDHEDTSDLTTP